MLEVDNITGAGGDGFGDLCMNPTEFEAWSPGVTHGKFIGVGVIANNHADMMVINDVKLWKSRFCLSCYF